MDLVAILQRARAGDPAAREQLLGGLYPRVCNLVHRKLDADFRRHHAWILPLFSTGDVVQEVFLGVVHGMDAATLPSETDALEAYLAVMVRNRLLDAVRHHEAGRRDVRRNVVRQDEEQEVSGSGDAPAVDPTPSLAASLGEQLSIYQTVLEEFDDNKRRLLSMRLEQEIPFAEIATELGHASADAARQAFRHAHARLLVRLRARGLQPPGNPVLEDAE